MLNKMAEVAKLLGVELYEEFEVEDTLYGVKYQTRVSDVGLENYQDGDCCGGNGAWMINNAMLRDLLVGRMGFQIISKPWKPKHLERYWTYYGDMFEVSEASWDCCAADYARFKSGMVFRTKTEAITARPRVYEEMTGKKWEGDDE